MKPGPQVKDGAPYGRRGAVIVNDMSGVNIDAQLVKAGGFTRADEKRVEMQNVCICCTRREDLLVQISRLARSGRVDSLLIESTGISEPMPVAETFTFADAQGQSLSDVARLDTLVTVVDGYNFLRDYERPDGRRLSFRAMMPFRKIAGPMARTPVRQTPSKHSQHRHDHTVQAEVLLREHGLKVTRPRLLVLKALLDRHRPTSPQELLESIPEHGLDQVTVYRTMTTLAESNVAQLVSTTDGSRRFEVHACEGCRIDHPHLQCRTCGQLDCLEEGVLPAPIIPTRLGGYLIDEAKLYLFGTCPACQAASKGKRGVSSTARGSSS